MDRKKLMSRVIPAVVAGSVLLSTGSLVFAQSKTQASGTATSKTQHAKKEFKNSAENIKSKLDKLVTASTITQDQETKVLDFMKQKDDQRKAEMDKVKNMSEAERQAYFASKSKEKQDLASELVSTGIVSQDQANAIVKAIQPADGFKGPRGNKGLEQYTERLKAEFDKLVSSSVISSDQETKILDYIKQKDDARKTEMDKIKNMSKTERQSYFANKSKEKSDLFSELVSNGIITQDQANAIKKAMPTPNKAGDKHNRGLNNEETNTSTNS